MLNRLRLSTKIAVGILAAWFLLFPITVNALGFGNINMKSALNEPLVAEIELLSATADDVKNLEVKLASQEAFMRSGVDRSGMLARIKFKIIKRGGKYFINLRTEESIREPFLNFLLEMNWKSGRMLREFTVLLDPPDRKQSQQQMAAPETTPAQTFVEPAPSPLVEETAAPEPAPMATAPEPAPMAAAPVPAPEPAAPESPFLDEQAASPASDEGGLFPQVPLDQAPQVPAEGPDAVASLEPEPMPAPEPMAAPEPAPEPVDAPEPVAEVAPVPADETELMVTPPSKAELPEDAAEPAFQEAEDGLFPQIPLKAYSEAQHQPADAPALAAADEPAVEPYEPVGELDYGITKKGDSAWKIASKLKPSEQISVYQVMMALQQSNPSAFVDGNIHRLKQGQVLRIDDASLLTAISKEQAAEQYQAQTQVWEDYLARIGASVPRQTIVAGAEPAQAGSAAEPGGELTLAPPSGDAMSAGDGGTGAGSQDSALLKEQVRQAMAEAENERSKNAQLSRKLDQLEEELKRLENLVTVKDSDLAALQSRLKELNEQRASAPVDVAQAEPEPEPEPQPAPEASPEPEPVTPEPEVALVEPQPEAIEPIEPSAEAQPEPIEPVTPEAIEPSPLDAPVAPEQPSAATPPAQKGGGIMDTIMGMLGGLLAGGTLMYIVFGVVGVVVLLLLVMIIIRRRKGVSFQESILTGGSAAESAEISVDATPSQGSLMGGESSFLSDFAISGVSAIQAEDSEVDPLTEADVFMAYGRYEAAEERLQEAINQDPGRGELRVKLLELFNTTKNKAGFESAAEEFYASLGDSASSDPLWQKVVGMGSEIAPSNPLFSGGGGVSPSMGRNAGMDPTSTMDDEVMDIGLDTGVFSNSELNGPGSTTEQAAEAYTGDLDFSLDDDTSGPDSVNTGLDFSLDSDESSAEMAQPTADDLQFDLNTAGDESTQTAIEGDGLDFSLDDTTSGNASDDLSMSFDLAGDEDPTATDIQLGMTEDFDAPKTEASSGGLDFDLNTDDDVSDISSAGMDMNLDAGDAIDLDMPTGGDEVGTKLDLARAYIDMGDPDGARSILDEVIDEGDAGQKQEAEQLMSQIG